MQLILCIYLFSGQKKEKKEDEGSDALWNMSCRLLCVILHSIQREM